MVSMFPPKVLFPIYLEYLMTTMTRDDAQHVLDTCHSETMECIQMYASGLITLPEMVNHLILVKRVYISVISTDGVFDPATGLSPLSLQGA